MGRDSNKKNSSRQTNMRGNIIFFKLQVFIGYISFFKDFIGLKI